MSDEKEEVEEGGVEEGVYVEEDVEFDEKVLKILVCF